MTFTSSIFFIGFFPWLLAFILCFGKKQPIFRRILICISNTIFYIWSGIGAFVFMCLYTILVWLFSNILKRYKNKKIFSIIIILTLLPLTFIKYINFIIVNINNIFNMPLNNISIIVPIGISFFTFEAVSLIVDVYKGKIENKLRLDDIYLYLSFFPTVTSGPIVRFNEFKKGIENNNYLVDYNRAFERISVGLCKKVLIADKIYVLVDYYFNGIAIGNRYSCLGLWTGSFAYSLQLYFDFSGYSDIAIGIGALLGFEIKENFNKPYQASSISDFWKRWHISLTEWFRDYVYIPLGGNRCSISRHLLNMLIVWFITGIWHGADWSFVIWGLGYFVLLVMEKYVPMIKSITKSWWGHVYALFFVNFLWIPFRANNMASAILYINGMFNFKNCTLSVEEKAVRFMPLLLVAALLCLPWNKWFSIWLNKRWFKVIRSIILILLFLLCICAIINASYAPYIYGNF